MPHFRLASVLLLAAAAGCNGKINPSPRPAPRGPALSADDQVRLVVFQELRRRREQFYQDEAPNRIRAFYLSLWTADEEDSDPGEALFAAMEARRYPLGKVSRCLREVPRGAAVQFRCVDKATGLPGCILWVGELRWLDDATAELDAGWWEDGLSFGGAAVQAHWERGCWELRYAKSPGAP
jgi:hypothetical protein